MRYHQASRGVSDGVNAPALLAILAVCVEMVAGVSLGRSRSRLAWLVVSNVAARCGLPFMKLHTLTIVGVGLIGGSIGLAAKRRGLAERVLGTGRQQGTLDRARKVGAIDEGTLDMAAAVAAAQLVVFCTPVDRIAAQVLETAGRCAPGTLLTDAGSTKGDRSRPRRKLPAEVHFVGSHPWQDPRSAGPNMRTPSSSRVGSPW